MVSTNSGSGDQENLDKGIVVMEEFTETKAQEVSEQDKKIAAVMRKILEEPKRDQKEVAEKMGISPQFLNQMLKEKRTISVENLEKFAEVTGVPAARILYMTQLQDNEQFELTTEIGEWILDWVHTGNRPASLDAVRTLVQKDRKSTEQNKEKPEK